MFPRTSPRTSPRTLLRTFPNAGSVLTTSTTSLSSFIFLVLTVFVSTMVASLDESATVDEVDRGEVEEGSVGCNGVVATAAVSYIPLSVDAVLLTATTETGTEPGTGTV